MHKIIFIVNMLKQYCFNFITIYKLFKQKKTKKKNVKKKKNIKKEKLNKK